MDEFRALSKLLETVLPSAADVPAADSLQQKLAHCWQQQAGTAAGYSRPLLFTSGRLVVFVESASWGNEIRHRSQSLLDALVENGVRVNFIEVKVVPDSVIARDGGA